MRAQEMGGGSFPSAQHHRCAMFPALSFEDNARYQLAHFYFLFVSHHRFTCIYDNPNPLIAANISLAVKLLLHHGGSHAQRQSGQY
jgi:hypothetical protein